MIEKIDQTRLDKIRAKTPESLPINPSTSGMSPQAVRRHFYAGMTDENESVVAELNRIVDEVNEEIETINGNADGLDTRLETAESEIDTLQTDMAGAEADITLLGANIQNLGDTVGAIQEKDSEQDNRLTLSESDIAHIEAIINNLELGIVPREIHNAGDMLESINPSLDYRENDNPDNPTLSERLTSWIVTNLGRQPNETDALMVKDIAEPNKDYVHTYFYWEALGTHEAGWRLADIGHAPPPIEQQRIEFTEASTRANIGTGESTATLFGKIKKWYTDLKTHAFNDLATTLGTETDKAPTNKLLNDTAALKANTTDLKPHAFTTPSSSQGTGTTTVPSDKLLKESSFARVYRHFTELGLDVTFTPEQLFEAMVGNSTAILDVTAENTGLSLPFPGYGLLIATRAFSAARCSAEFIAKVPNTTALYQYSGTYRTGDTSNKWSGWKQIIDDSSAQTITGVKTYTASPIVPTTPSGPSAAVSKSYADSVGFAKVYRSFNQLVIPNSSTIAEIHAAMIDRSKALIAVSTYDHPVYGNTGLELPNDIFYGLEAIRLDSQRLTLKLVGKASNSDVLYHYEGMYWNYGTTDKFTGWKRVINDADAQTITGVKTFATGATPLITDAPTTDLMAVNKAYADGLTGLAKVYDKVIRTQAEFEELIASPTWLGATSVALVGQFVYDEPNNSGVKIPETVKQIHGFNSAKITVTNFVHNFNNAKGGLWYGSRPTTLDYSIRDLEVDCTGDSGSLGYGFYNCTNLTNCTGTGTGTGTGGSGYGFRNCTNLTNCTGTGTGAGTYGYGFYYCTNLTNCTGTGTGAPGYGFSNCTNLTNCTGTGTGEYGYGFSNCTNLTNCTGTGTGDIGFGFYNITYASNCKDGGSSTNMWYGKNTNIDVDTCCYTPVEADNTTLNV